MQKKIRKQWIIVGIVCFILAGASLQQLFMKKINFKVAVCEQEQELFTEQFNSKLSKLNKQLTIAKDDNRNLKNANQELEQKLEEFQRKQHDTLHKLEKIKEQKLQLEKKYRSDNNSLQQQLKNLNKDYAELHALVKELQQQIKNYKMNSYGLFQAGKLEMELSNVEQQLVEQYENIAQKKNGIGLLQAKCGKLRMNSKFCKEYDAALSSTNLLEKQLEHLQNKREDLKQRINIYLSSSVQTHPH